MGGYGSGYQGIRRATVEETTEVDVRWLKRNGVLEAGSHTLRWSDGGSIEVVSDGLLRAVRFIYRTKGSRDTEWTPVDCRVRLIPTPTHFGGQRHWFQCPYCSRRCANLYLAGHKPICRTCAGLTYTTSQSDGMERARAALRKLKRRLKAPDWDESRSCPPPRPKGMHWRTYERLCLDWHQHHHRLNLAFIASARSLLLRIDPALAQRLKMG